MNKKSAISGIALLALPSVMAQFNPPSPGQMLHNIEPMAQSFFVMLQNQYVEYTLTLGFSFLLFFVLYGASAKKIKIFEGSGGLGLNRMGQLFALACSGLTCVGIFALQKSLVET